MSNVIDMFANRDVKKTETEEKKPEESFDFETIMKKNKENAERQKNARAKANSSVKRSYRLDKGKK